MLEHASTVPWPNNMMLLASGVNFGLRRMPAAHVRHQPGFRLLVMAVGLGLGQVFKQVPQLYTLLRYLGAAYLLYLAWKIANSGAPDSQSRPQRWEDAPPWSRSVMAA
ncbi:LysE family translocator [Pseudomonas tumuqii]|uniref:LysE family translocator n=1 Tax=Pseudomonas tumuqii TaxID=2715755 RepID=UPI0036F1FE15